MSEPEQKPEAPEEASSILVPTVVLSLILALAGGLLFGLSRC